MCTAMTVSAQARLILLLWIVFNKNSSCLQVFCVQKVVNPHSFWHAWCWSAFLSAATCHHLGWTSLLSFKINQVPSAFKNLFYVVFCRPWTNMFNKASASTEPCGNHSSGAPGVGLWPTAPWKCRVTPQLPLILLEEGWLSASSVD